MIRRIALALVLILLAIYPAAAQWQVTNHGVPIGRGPGVIGFSVAPTGTAGRVLIDQGAGADPVFRTISGDCTLTLAGVITCSGGSGTGTVTTVSVATANGFAGSVANATTTPAITLSTSITGILSGNGTAISAASTTGSGNVVLATSPTVSGLTVTGAFTATGLVGNASLTNPSTTVNGQTCTLGSTCTVTAAATSIAVGATTVTSGTTTRVLFNNAGTLGEYVISGTGSVAMTTSPVLVTPTLGVASATSINKVAITAPATSATLTLIDGTTLTGPASSGTAMTLGNTETVTGVKTFGSSGAVGRLRIAGTTSGTTILDATATASGTLTLPAATDTLVGKATTDTFTNKTYDTAGTGNSFSINSVAVTANTGTGAVARATSPTFATNITAPIVIGGTATNASLTLQSTSGVGSGDTILFKTGNNGATTVATIANGALGIGLTPGGTFALETNSAVKLGGVITVGNGSGLTSVGDFYYDGDTAGSGGTTGLHFRTGSGLNSFLDITDNAANFPRGVSTPAPATKTGTSYSMAVTDGSLIINASGPFTLTLLNPATYPGRWLWIKSIAAQTVASATSNVVPRTTATPGTAILASGAGNWAALQSDGTSWVTMQGN